MVNEEILDIVERIKEAVPFVEKIYLFGSYARGTQTEDSDYDFFVVIPDGSMREIKVMQVIQHKIHEKRVDKSIDVLACTHTNFHEMKEELNALERTVVKEGILLYEQQQKHDFQVVSDSHQ